jgi:hypothetical protein
MLTLKMFLFLAMELSVVILFGSILLIGLYKIVQLKIRQSRLADQLQYHREWELPSRSAH